MVFKFADGSVSEKGGGHMLIYSSCDGNVLCCILKGLQAGVNAKYLMCVIKSCHDKRCAFMSINISHRSGRGLFCVVCVAATVKPSAAESVQARELPTAGCYNPHHDSARFFVQ